eukprot:TRINITY_DN42129_c0_g1_i1.p1 TRINITY_DN42129_c0_g1~~TRINITY_DN42129_c0_g1_i1.p1  ORF type:complete len:405 (+),score=64.55 TRINITY_DN42129_c0_g1_i1:37-1251(+)
MMGDSKHLRAAAVASAAAGLGAVAFLVLHRRRRRLPDAFSLSKVVRPCVLKAKPYVFPPRFEHAGTPVLLDANENPHGAPIDDPFLQQLSLERYPDPAQTELKQALARLRGCHPEQILVGVGSDEIIDLLIRITCTPGKDSIMVCSPTYAMYATFAAINDVGVVDASLEGGGQYQLQLGAIQKAMRPSVKLIFLCSPGNPTGRLLKRSDIEQVLTMATNAIVVVDEAYIDFALEGSCMSLLRESVYPNLVISQTLSKAWGLAGARIGVAFAPHDIIAIMDKVKAPFNLSILTEQTALRALKGEEVVQQKVHAILAERKRVATRLQQAPFFGPHAVLRVHESDANFLLVQIADAKTICHKMAKDDNVVVRYRGSMLHCEDCVRITIGTAAENEKMFEALRRAINL